MARIRTVKPEFWTDEKVVECSIPARLLFIGLFNFANDMGCLERSPKRLKMQIFPADSLDCEPLIQELITHGLLNEYSVNDVCYLQIKGFLKHQKINRPSASKIPLPPEFTESKAGKEEKRAPNQGGLSEDSVNPHGGLTDGKGREEKGKGSNPTLYAQERNFPQQPQYLPGVDIPIGKFAMHDLWLPSQDWPRLAATWGIALPEPAYLPTELAEFIAYWKSEGKVFTQIQWEQKFVRSVISARAKSKPQPATGGKGHAGIQPANTASRAVQEIQAARERWEKQNGLAGGGYGLAAMDGNGGDILEPVDPEERGGALGYVDCPDWIDE
ncbi:DnaT-like ssDNA-binding domain-containing protein [Klebsiella grimontii]|uniref:DnaT-like ssDNA-binding domain-containing protein n=1 Tax=Klebsiella grimontii TaxID=2058152 RepID=UPI0012B6C49A|nr:DnaT-like ssDNA-binding domain-containing protein [Klebsiella grimontii]